MLVFRSYNIHKATTHFSPTEKSPDESNSKKKTIATAPIPYRVAVKELYLTAKPYTFPVGDTEKIYDFNSNGQARGHGEWCDVRSAESNHGG